MKITTIQIRQNVKRELERLKEKPNESYEDVIVKLIDERGKRASEQEKLMIEGYEEMAEESLKIAKEWEGTLMDGLDKNEKWDEL